MHLNGGSVCHVRPFPVCLANTYMFVLLGIVRIIVGVMKRSKKAAGVCETVSIKHADMGGQCFSCVLA